MVARLQAGAAEPVGGGHTGLALRLDGDELQGVFAAGDGDGGEGEQFTRGAVTGGKTTLVSTSDGYRTNSHYPMYEKVIQVISDASGVSSDNSLRSMMKGVIYSFLRTVI